MSLFWPRWYVHVILVFVVDGVVGVAVSLSSRLSVFKALDWTHASTTKLSTFLSVKLQEHEREQETN